MRAVIFLFCLIPLLALLPPSEENQRQGHKITFGPGEELNYRVHYGFLNAAVARMVIGEDIHYVNGQPCMKIDVYGESVGMFDLFTRIRDNWGTYFDTTNIRPARFYRVLEEGKYRKNEVVTFDHSREIAYTREFSFSQNRWKPVVEAKVPSNVQDLVSGYYFLRTYDFSKNKPGDLITLKAFFDKEMYDFKIRFVGREEVKTNLGVIRSLVLSPIMPENSLFDGENSIRIWISDDINKVPLKIKANMFVGAVEIDIESFKKGKVK
ncbi:DUF3108 domain-containing protein [Fulvivirga sedimenti]|uniref:DUF3108 domain-containing protein n=1 Tax=Fulvivirga sedimenti TaxID=2879465 RepID=A0A9X1KX78_9BACT|nr:DUF3108 domain-containing protein [Fulvivirga sedimenti]MCA6073952.1 DUF3108 domain-containing protein [Fulvivirga sedimenti]